MNVARFEILDSKDNQIYFVLKAKNGEIILVSETYKSMQGLLNGIRSVKENSLDKGNFKISKSEDDKDYFVLRAKNNKVIGVSEMYESVQNAHVGINAVMLCAPECEIKYKNEK